MDTSPPADSIIVGVDTHKDSHVAVAINQLGTRLDGCSVPATLAGYHQLLAWALELGPIHTIGIEGTGSYGCGLARFLQRQQLPVVEVYPVGNRRTRRDRGKDDTLDAEQTARQVLARQGLASPKRTDDSIAMMRAIKVAKDTAVKAQTQVLVALKALLVTADEELRAQLEPLSAVKLVAACAELAVDALETPAAAMSYALSAMAQRWLQLQGEIETHRQHLSALTEQTAPALLQAVGVGPDTAAQMLMTFGGRNRVQSEAGFAKMCGVCPIPASSGKRQRYRLNRGGNRQANAALFRIVIVRMRWHEATKAYVSRRQAEGLSKREIIRCLKRYVAREIYHLIRQEPPAPKETGILPSITP